MESIVGFSCSELDTPTGSKKQGRSADTGLKINQKLAEDSNSHVPEKRGQTSKSWKRKAQTTCVYDFSVIMPLFVIA